MFLPSPAYNDVIAPTVVQVLVDAAGHIVSTVMLAGSGVDSADQRALDLARAARFFPASGPALGRIIFNWHTVPAPVSAPAVSP
jgi:TonB family protein